MIDTTTDDKERRRLKNLNNSMLQRLKKRREQENETEVKKVVKSRISDLCDVLTAKLNKREIKGLMKDLKAKDKYSESYPEREHEAKNDKWEKEFKNFLSEHIDIYTLKKSETIHDIKNELLNQPKYT